MKSVGHGTRSGWLGPSMPGSSLKHAATLAAGAVPIACAHHCIATDDRQVPMRPGIVWFAQRSTPLPSPSTIASQSSSQGPRDLFGEGSMPASVIDAIHGRCRCASSNAMSAPSLVATRCTRVRPSAAIICSISSAQSAIVKPSGSGLERPKPRRSGRSTRYRRASCGTHARQVSARSAMPCSNNTVSGVRQPSV